jgi:hypothetical protein
MQPGLYICYDMILINAAIQLLPQNACSCFALFTSSCVIFVSMMCCVWKKSISPPHLWWLDYITPQPMKRSISPPELCKTGQITPYYSFEKS